MKNETKEKALKQRNRDFYIYFCSGNTTRETAIHYKTATASVERGIDRLLLTAYNQMTKAEKATFDSQKGVIKFKELVLKAYDREDDSHLIGKLTLQSTVDEFIFTTRAGNTLRWFYDGYSLSKVTIERLAKDFTENTSEFRKMPNLGKVCFDEIKNTLIRHGFIEENIASLVYSLKAQEANMFTKPPLSPAVALTLQEMSLVKMLKEVVTLLKEDKYVFLVVGNEDEEAIVKRMIGNNQLYPYLQYLSVVDIVTAFKYLDPKEGKMSLSCIGGNECRTVMTRSVGYFDNFKQSDLDKLFTNGDDFIVIKHESEK